MFDIVRDSTLGQGLNALFGVFPYEDQRPEYVVPSRYLPTSRGLSTAPTVVDEKAAKFSLEKTPSALPVSSAASSSSDLRTVAEDSRRQSTATFVASHIYPGRDEQNDHVEDGLKKEEHYNLDVTPGEGQIQPPVDHPEYVIVGWNGDDDQDNPRNWSLCKRGFVAGQIMLLTFAVCKCKHASSAVQALTLSLIRHGKRNLHRIHPGIDGTLRRFPSPRHLGPQPFRAGIRDRPDVLVAHPRHDANWPQSSL